MATIACMSSVLISNKVSWYCYRDDGYATKENTTGVADVLLASGCGCHNLAFLAVIFVFSLSCAHCDQYGMETADNVPTLTASM
jgi:hypothetical protein